MNKTKKLYRLSRVSPKAINKPTIPDTVNLGKAYDILFDAQRCWDRMDLFRRERERCKRYCYGRQWDDRIVIDGHAMTEGEYIARQGRVPLKNNLIRRLVRSMVGVYRAQTKSPVCIARDRDEQEEGEVMTSVLQYNMQLNQMSELYARSMEDYLIGGFIAHKKTHGWRNNQLDCWTDYKDPARMFIDTHTRDMRGWDMELIGEVHDMSFGELQGRFAHSAADVARLREIYRWAGNEARISSFAEDFGHSRFRNIDFLLTNEPGRCRVIEVWRKESMPRFLCIDPQNGDAYKIEIAEEGEIDAINEERLRLGEEQGMERDDIPLIEKRWFSDYCWRYYYLSPFGDILDEGETPYAHGGHPYVFKAYPFIDGEIHSFVADVIDQQRYVNRLITMYDWIMGASAKGVLLMPEDSLPDGVSMDDIAERWTEFNGVIVFRPSKSGQLPQQVAVNSTNIGISELLNIQMKLLEEISGVQGALQGKPGYSGTSAALYAQQTQNATTSILDILESFSSFVKEAAQKDVRNIQQFYEKRRVSRIAGASGGTVLFDPQKMRDVVFDLTISESTDTPVYRQMQNDMLMELWKAQAITVEQLLENGSFPFADKLLQSIRSARADAERTGEAPSLPAQDFGANPQASQALYNAMLGGGSPLRA